MQAAFEVAALGALEDGFERARPSAMTLTARANWPGKGCSPMRVLCMKQRLRIS